MPQTKKKLLLFMLSFIMGALLRYLLPLLIDNYYSNLELIIPYKVLLTISVVLFVSTLYLLVHIFYPWNSKQIIESPLSKSQILKVSNG